MTNATISGSNDVRSRFTRCRCAVMTGSTTACDLRMIDRSDWLPRHGYMAGLTLIAGQDMRCIFAGAAHTVMTSRTIIADAIVRKVRRLPCDGCMAAITLLAGRNMRSQLACRANTVVTG